MLCDICGEREAIVVVQKISNNKKKELCLCIKCASERGLVARNGKLEMSLSGLFEEAAAMKQFDKMCPVCGRKLSDIKKTMIANCPECYSIFSNEIQALIKEKGGSEPYSGTMPERLANFRSILTDRMVLRTKMEESVAIEDYEKAALYRDRLRALEKCAVANGDIFPKENNDL